MSALNSSQDVQKNGSLIRTKTDIDVDSARENLDRWFSVRLVKDRWSDEHRRWFVDAVGWQPIDDERLREMAEMVIDHVQRQLRSLEPTSPLAWEVAYSFARDQLHAVTALIDLNDVGRRRGEGEAKKTLLRIASGRPLAICTGDVCRLPSQRVSRLPLKVNDTEIPSFTVRGCGAIFPDATVTRGKMWPTLCPRCTNLKSLRKQERALVKKIKTGLRNPTVYVSDSPPANRCDVPVGARPRR